MPQLPDNWVDPRGTIYGTDDPHVTTWELGKAIGMWPESVHRWCKQWFGALPVGRTGAKAGYRIPPEYMYVARAWRQTEDRRIRRIAHRALVENPRNYLVVVDTIGTTHYNEREVSLRVESLLSTPTFNKQPITILYVGD